MVLKFEWDKRKSVLNIKKHRVSFEDAATAFGGPLSVTIHGPKHFDDEDRFLLLGETQDKKLVVVAHTDRKEPIRLINACPATRLEREDYENS